MLENTYSIIGPVQQLVFSGTFFLKAAKLSLSLVLHTQNQLKTDFALCLFVINYHLLYEGRFPIIIKKKHAS